MKPLKRQMVLESEQKKAKIKEKRSKSKQNRVKKNRRVLESSWKNGKIIAILDFTGSCWN
ncbi:MAG: hypothetical protein R6V54_14125 [Desulfobacteraceae bacterium]